MRENKTKDITNMGILAALTIIATLLIRIPVPATQGYVHPGDALLLLTSLAIGKYKGSFAGALGQGLADLFGGYAIFAPITLVDKFLMGILLYQGVRFLIGQDRTAGRMAAGVFCIGLSLAAMIGTYYLAESAIYGSFLVPLAEIPANLIQFAFGAVLAIVITGALYRTPARNYFAVFRP